MESYFLRLWDSMQWNSIISFCPDKKDILDIPDILDTLGILDILDKIDNKDKKDKKDKIYKIYIVYKKDIKDPKKLYDLNVKHKASIIHLVLDNYYYSPKGVFKLFLKLTKCLRNSFKILDS